MKLKCSRKFNDCYILFINTGKVIQYTKSRVRTSELTASLYTKNVDQ